MLVRAFHPTFGTSARPAGGEHETDTCARSNVFGKINDVEYRQPSRSTAPIWPRWICGASAPELASLFAPARGRAAGPPGHPVAQLIDRLHRPPSLARRHFRRPFTCPRSPAYLKRGRSFAAQSGRRFRQTISSGAQISLSPPLGEKTVAGAPGGLWRRWPGGNSLVETRARYRSVAIGQHANRSQAAPSAPTVTR